MDPLMEDWTLDLDFAAEALKAMAEAVNAAGEVMRQVALKEVERLLREIEQAKHPIYEKFWTHEPVIGWRMWNLTGRPKTILMGANGVPWRKPVMKATHSTAIHLKPPHPAPHWNCGCGINAMKTKEDLGFTYLFGQVALTGVVHEYTNGYRAERGEILNLYLQDDSIAWAQEQVNPESLAKILADHYKVPVELIKRRRFRHERW